MRFTKILTGQCEKLPAACNEAGFSLVEMLVVILIFGIVIAISSQMATLFITGGNQVDAEFNALNKAQLTEMGLARYIRMATQPVAGAAPFLSAGPYSATAFVNTNNPNGLDELVIRTTASGELTSTLIPPVPGSCGQNGCQYNTAGTGSLEVQTDISNQSSNTPLLTYQMASGATSTNPPTSCTGSSTICLSNIVAVQINIVVPSLKNRPPSQVPPVQIKTTTYLEAPIYNEYHAIP